jgi:putative transposase
VPAAPDTTATAVECLAELMGGKLDNAPMESFFASLKKEHVYHVRFRTREEAKAAVFDYIEIFYNRQRLNSAIGYRTPVEARVDMLEVRMLAAA